MLCLPRGRRKRLGDMGPGELSRGGHDTAVELVSACASSRCEVYASYADVRARRTAAACPGGHDGAHPRREDGDLKHGGHEVLDIERGVAKEEVEGKLLADRDDVAEVRPDIRDEELLAVEGQEPGPLSRARSG